MLDLFITNNNYGSEVFYLAVSAINDHNLSLYQHINHLFLVKEEFWVETDQLQAFVMTLRPSLMLGKWVKPPSLTSL